MGKIIKWQDTLFDGFKGNFVLEQQAEKSFKAGMKEVIDCVEKNKVLVDYYQSDGSIAMRKGEILIGREYWENKLKEWGIKED
jgi:hypothetical protein